MPNVQPANPINIETTRAPKNHSNFDLSRYIGLTPRFGVNTAFYSEEVVPDDGPITIEPSCDTRSYTLKAPMFGDIKKHVAFYQVPLQCILPLNWEKIIVNSSKGSDVQGDSASGDLVPALDGVNCVVSNFARRIVNAFDEDFQNLKTELDEISPIQANADGIKYIQHVLHFIVRWEMFFSNGCLLSNLGIHYGHLLQFKYTPSGSSTPTATRSFDYFCQDILSPVERLRFSLTDDDGTSSVSGFGAAHIRKCLDFMRSHSGPFVVSGISLVNSPTTSPLALYSLGDLAGEDTEPLNFGRLVAYQIVNAHYYTNDKIDYIYSADLYRQYIGSLLFPVYDTRYFVYNGLNCQYDWLSGYFLNLVISDLLGLVYSSDNFWHEVFPYLNAIFGFNYSLRFMDYFVGARPRNLAISGPNTPTNVAVNSDNTVSVINTTKSIVAQRFLNAVARAGQSIENYSSKVLGKYISPDWHNPKFLFDFDVNLFASEIENTGAAQQTQPNSVTSVLRGKAGNLQFTFDIDRHSFIVGIEYFDIRRFYYTTQDRNTMAIDRFDMFVPELQYIGDQELKRSELIAGVEKDVPFGYTLRDMQFKQSFDICSGGFVENLPGWLATFDIDEMTSRQVRENLFISPEFIRSRPSEVDKFYLSLTGLTLASYFHFIELWHVKVSANRPMVYAPQIL